MTIIPKNWVDFQHYKDRAPPWIKLHKSLLDNYDYQSLPVASRALAPMLWLLASEHSDGHIDATHKKLAFRLRMTEREVNDALKPLIDNGFFAVVGDASGLLAQRNHRACLETETETETKGEKRQSICAEPLSDSTLNVPVITIPLIDKTEHPVGQVQLDEWASAYPAVDVMQQLRNMRQWCAANPTKRKTARGINAFIVRWLSDKQDKPSQIGNADRNQTNFNVSRYAGAAAAIFEDAVHV